MQFSEKLLPDDLLERATLRGNEYAWRVDDIPKVIEAAREANLVSIGGQLQFRFADGGTCDCYWIDVDTSRTVSSSLPWPERVIRAAEAALSDFQELRASYDFLAEGRTAFAHEFETREADGGDLAAAMCFVWYVTTPAEEAEIAAA